MTTISNKITLIASGFVAAVLLGSPLALASGDHGKDAKVVACHEAHEKMMGGKMDAKHMKGCHDKDGKLIGNADGHMGKDMKMPMGDHKMGDHKMGGKKMDHQSRGSN